MPERVRRVAGPLIHPIAVGPRSSGHVLVIPGEAAPRSFDVIVDAIPPHSETAEHALSTLARGGHRVFALEAGMPLADLAMEQSIVDAIYVVRPLGSEERGAAAVCLGFRCVPEADLGTMAGIDAAFPKVTIIVVTHRNRALCEACLGAVTRNTPWPGLEVFVVDNGSRDGTARMLEELRARDHRVQVISNDDNFGFARATNQGLRRARGEIVVLLNDDAIVGPGWLSRLVMHLESDARLGLVCPVTNEIGGDAKVPVTYETFREMEQFAIARAQKYAGQRRATKTVALFCAAARRSTLASVGFLDERYEVGMFEDDDLSLSLHRHGMHLAVAEDAFVHHVGQATFGRLSDSEYLAIWEANRRRYELKWGERWRPPGPGT
jgi:GT2 family glycosyltransferase